MKVINPNASKPSDATKRAALDNWLKTSPDTKRAPAFDEIRAAIPALAACSDGELHQLAQDLGVRCE